MTRDGERLARYVGRVEQLLRALEPGQIGAAAAVTGVRHLLEGLGTESRWAMLLAERLMHEDDDGR